MSLKHPIKLKKKYIPKHKNCKLIDETMREYISLYIICLKVLIFFF